MLLARTVSILSIASEEEAYRGKRSPAATGFRERSEGVGGERVLVGAWKSEVPKRMSFEAADIYSRDFFSSGFCLRESVCVNEIGRAHV